MEISFLIMGLLLVSIPAFSQNVSKQYAEQVRSNATTFHKNFTTGDFEKNGPLVNEKIYVNSNNAIVIGRDNFVQRIKRFSIPFPTLALRDKVILVDGNQVGLLYVMQGTQDGPYGSIPSSGNKINVYAAEFFTMDENARMKELLTITQLDQLKRQIKGADQIDEFEEITLLPIKETSVEYKNKLKGKVEDYVQNFNTRDWDSFKKQFTDNVEININGTMLTGADELIEKLNERITVLPDVTYHLDRNVVEGDRGALAYTVNGTFTKENTDKTKDVVSREGVHFQFNNEGKIIEVVIVYNSDDLANQMKSQLGY